MLVKSPDASPLDFFGFGYLKQQLYKSKVTTLDGIWKKSQEVWQQIDNEMIQKVFSSWKTRLRAITKNNGEQIEQLKTIHSRKINL